MLSNAGTSAHCSVRNALPSASFTSQFKKSKAACLCSSEVASELSTKMYLEPPPTSFVFVSSDVFSGTGMIPMFSVKSYWLSTDQSQLPPNINAICPSASIIDVSSLSAFAAEPLA